MYDFLINESMCWISSNSDMMIDNDRKNDCTQNNMKSNELIWTCDSENSEKNEDNDNIWT